MEDLDDLIGLIYEAGLRPELWDDVLDGLRMATPCLVASLYSHDRIARTPTFDRVRGADEAGLVEYRTRYAASNPIIDALATLSPGDVAGLTSILDYDAFTQSEFYREWGCPRGYCDAINVMLERTPTRIASVSLIRHDDHGLADDGSIRRLRRLAPHLLRAIRISRVLDHSETRRDQLSHVIDALSEAILIIDRHGGIVQANSAASALLGRGISAIQLSQFAMRDDAGGDAMLASDADGLRYICHRLPLVPVVKGRSQALAREQRLVVARRLDAASTGIDLASSLFGLTRRERDVLLGLVQIGNMPSIAAVFGISASTVHTHLTSLFAKTGTSRQADLVRLLSSLADPINPGVRDR